MAVDFSTFPQALGVDVERVDLETGKPTRPALDNEAFLNQWVQDNTQALDHAIILVEATANDALSGAEAASAAVIIEATARADADGALATAVIEAEARATGGSEATAQMQLQATAGVAGAAAEFSWFLRASGVDFPVGMVAYAGGGVASIAFQAQQFSLTDPFYLGGAPGNVFFYDGTSWRFGVPVILDTGELATNAVTHLASNSGFIQSSSLSVTKSFYGGTDALVTITLEPVASLAGPGIAAALATQRTYPITLDFGTPFNSLTAYDVCVGANSATVRNVADTGGESVVGSLLFYPQGVAKQVSYPAVPAGTHTFSVFENDGLLISATITVTEFKR